MGSLPQLVNGFLKFHRFGPPTLVKQKNNDRAPEKMGLWAFPYPYFDWGYVYHRALQQLPKEFRGYPPSDPKWFQTLEGADVESLEGLEADEDGFYPGLHVRQEWFNTRHSLASKRLKSEQRRIFWYSGPVYTHLASRGDPHMSFDAESEWELTDSTDLYRRIIRTRGDRGWDPDSGQNYRFSHDHLEIFIPRGGKLRSRPV